MLYTSRSLTNLSGTLSPTLRVELVGKAHRTVVGYISIRSVVRLTRTAQGASTTAIWVCSKIPIPHPGEKLAVSAQALTLGRNCAGIVKLEANQLQAFAKNAEVLTCAWFPTRFDLRVI